MPSKILNHQKKIAGTITAAPIGTGILAFRDLPAIFDKYIKGKEALDFGCGSGRSSRFLQKLGFTVIGIDSSEDMIDKAVTQNDGITYRYAKKENFELFLKKYNKKFDIIFISFVLMEMPEKNIIVETLKKLISFLSLMGRIVIITASDDLYKSNWLSMDTDYKKNINADSGDRVRIFLKDYDVEVVDYFWKEKDCECFFDECGLSVIEKRKPLGVDQDGKKWVDEFRKAPFVIYVLSNKGQSGGSQPD